MLRWHGLRFPAMLIVQRARLGKALMAAGEKDQSNVAKFPLVGPDSPEVSALVAIVRRLSVARSVPEIMDIVAHSARTLIGADGITFVLRDGDRCYYAEEDAIGPLWKGQRFPMSACISGWCMLERRAAVIPDIYQDDRIPQDAYRPTFVRSLAMVPVRQDDPIAAMGAYWAACARYSRARLSCCRPLRTQLRWRWLTSSRAQQEPMATSTPGPGLGQAESSAAALSQPAVRPCQAKTLGSSRNEHSLAMAVGVAAGSVSWPPL